MAASDMRSSPFSGALIVAALLAGAVTPSTAAAQVYRWVDERGVVHYGERPPSGTAVRPVDGPTPAPAAAPKAKADDSQPERGFQKRRIERERQEERERKEAANAKAQCERERLQLARLRESRRVTAGVNEKGERRYLDDGERAEAMRRQEAVVAQRCP